MSKVIVFGAGQLSEVARFYLTHDSPHEVVAFTVDADFLCGTRHLGLPMVPFENVESTYPPDDFHTFLPLRYKEVNHARARKYREAKAKSYRLVSYVSTRALVWPNLATGENCLIFSRQCNTAVRGHRQQCDLVERHRRRLAYPPRCRTWQRLCSQRHWASVSSAASMIVA